MQKVLVISAPTATACWAFYQSQQYCFDVIEIRLDCWELFSTNEIIWLKDKIVQPVILTLRSVAEGGAFAGDYLKQLTLLIDLCPDYLDVEARIGKSAIIRLKLRQPTVKLISSVHFIADAPADLAAVYRDMQIPEICFYKLIINAKSAILALTMMHFISNNPGVIAHAMGEAGVVTRIFAVIKQQPLIFIGAGITVTDMFCLYNIEQIQPDTKLFALIGMPISHSLGRSYHNARLNSVYVNLPLARTELSDFFSLLKGLPFNGFSVTTPLKTAIKSVITTNLPAVNTLIKTEDSWCAYNTDGAGVISLLPKTKGRILLIGAGGAAVAVAAEMQQKKIDFIVLNRTLASAQLLSNMAFDFKNFAKFPHETFTTIINTVPNDEKILHLLEQLLQNFINPTTTYLSLDYKNPANIRLPLVQLDAKEVFFAQAKLQLELFLHIDQ